MSALGWLLLALAVAVGAWWKRRADHRAEARRRAAIEALRRQDALDAQTTLEADNARRAVRDRTTARLNAEPTATEVRNTIDRVRRRPR